VNGDHAAVRVRGSWWCPGRPASPCVRYGRPSHCTSARLAAAGRAPRSGRSLTQCRPARSHGAVSGAAARVIGELGLRLVRRGCPVPRSGRRHRRYGYAPGRAVLLLAAAFVAGWLVFRTRHPVPVGPGPHPEFNAVLYTLDVLIPAPALGQASGFDPHGATLAAAGLHIMGWLLTITVIAAITRSFSRT
jgi:hypothetical protein